MENYTVIRKIGQGSFGNVWLIRNKNDKKQYILKQINLQNANNQELRAAQVEVQLLSSLHHPNIVSYQDAFKAPGGFLHIIMMFCDGGDLYTKIKERDGIYFQELQVMEWVIQICMALKYLHEKNILHRDLKTQNIFLTKSRVIKIGDLGIAKVLDSENAMATTLIGTPYYMSPELFSNKPYSYKSDVWALGCCIYEIVTLHHAFNARDMNSLMYKVLQRQLPEMPKHYSCELLGLIHSLLNVNPDERPSISSILSQSYMKKHITLFLEYDNVNALHEDSKCKNHNTRPLLSLNREELDGSQIGKGNNSNNNVLCLERQGLQRLLNKQALPASRINHISQRETVTTKVTKPKELIVNGQEIRLQKRMTAHDSPKFSTNINHINSRNKQNVPVHGPNSSFTKENSHLWIGNQRSTSSQHSYKIEHLDTPMKLGNISERQRRKENLKNQPQYNSVSAHHVLKYDADFKALRTLLDATLRGSNCEMHPRDQQTSYHSELGRDNTPGLCNRIAHLKKMCIKGLGQDILSKALLLVDAFSNRQLELSLKKLLGKENYIKYIGKIWQLKFCVDSATNIQS